MVVYICIRANITIMATIYYSLSAKENTCGLHEVLIRFTHGRLNQRAKTGIFVLPEYWSAKTQSVSVPRFRMMSPAQQEIVEQANEAHSKISALTSFVMQSFIEAGAGKVSLPPSWLRDVITPYSVGLSQDRDIWAHFESYVSKKGFSERRKMAFNVLMRALKRYELYKRIFDRTFTLSLGMLTPEVLDDFEDFYRREHDICEEYPHIYALVQDSRIPHQRGHNTVVSKMILLRAFLNWAANNDLIQTNPFRKKEIKQAVYGSPIYITIAERNKLYHTNLSRHQRLAVQRDIFVFQCLIGCRVGDLIALKRSNVVKGAVEYIPRKTKEGHPVTVRVPLNNLAKEIINKYASPDNALLLPFISEQKYNEAIKKCFLAAGLKRMVSVLNPVTREPEQKPLYQVASSHMARRTFIGNLYKQVKDPNLVGSLSGHTEGSKAFARYRDIDEEMKTDLVKLLE